MTYTLADLIDIEQFQMLQDRLNEIYSFPSAIIDLEGNVLTATAWQDACTKFHRQNRESEVECIKSDRYILDHLAEAEPAVSYRCPHGLVDNATPIVIDGVHYGNFFTGQFFLEERPDLEFFRNQAQRFGFDAEAYIDAVKRVPVWTKKQLDSYLFFIRGMIEVISGIGLKRLRELEIRKQLADSEERAEMVLRTMMDGFVLADTSGRILAVNDAYCRMSGYSRDELLSMSVSEVESQENPAETAAHIRRIMSAGQDRFETRHRRKDGRSFDVEVSIQFQPEGKGRFVGFFRDITVRKEVLQALRQGEERFSQIAHATSDIIWEVDSSGLITYISPTCEALLGYPVSQVVGRLHSFDFHPAEGREEFRRRFLEGMDAPSTIRDMPNELVARDGRILRVLTNGVPFFHPDGSLAGYRGAHRDITEQLLSRREQEEALDLFRETLSSLDEAVLVVGTETGEIYECNRRAEEIFGWPRSELIRKTSEFLHVDPDTFREFGERVLGQLSESDHFRFEFRMRRRNGEVFPTEHFGRPILTEGSIHSVVSVIRDVSESKKAEKERLELQAQLLHSQKMEAIGQLSGGMAHDFNNMLGVILSSTELARLEIPADSPAQADLSAITDAVERARDLTLKLLTFSRREKLDVRPVEAGSIVAGLRGILDRTLPKSIEIRAEVRGTFAIRCDRNQVQQALLNVCNNARDAMPNGGTLTIEAFESELHEGPCRQCGRLREGRSGVFRIGDTGVGIPKELLPKVTEPFFTTKAIDKGTGLGLSVTEGIVLSHGGHLHFESETGRGTRVELVIPLASETSSEDGSKQDRTSYAGRETILVVDDEEVLLRLAGRILRTSGYTPLLAASGSAALDLYRTHSAEIAVVVLDLMMPGMDGAEVDRRLKELAPGVKIVYASGFSADGLAGRLLAEPRRRFVQKPFETETLCRAIRELVDIDE